MKQYLGALVALMRREPVRSWAVIRTAGMFVLAVWPGLLTPDQVGALGLFGATLFGVDEVVRQQVRPTVKG